MENIFVASSSTFSQFLFIKLLSLCFFLAFYSLSKQVLGLYGSRGISPIGDLLHLVQNRSKASQYLYIPTIFWYSSSDKTLKNATLLGCILAILCFLDFFPALLLLALTLLYLSFTSVGSEFLSFQWDALLVEVGFIGFLIALQSPPAALVVALGWFMLFRLLFSSGMVKLLSHCPEWKGLTAMKFHYETQPLPNKGGFYAHHFLKNWYKIVTVFVYLFELVVPFFIFGGNFLRLIGALLSILFQLLIMATGNYAFFNFLTIALCTLLIDDKYLAWTGLHASINAFTPNLFLTFILSMAAILLLLVNGVMLASVFVPARFAEPLLYWFRHFQLVNSYGLFAVMTVERNEIILEGSQDGKNWKEYEFKWKPGDLSIPPLQVAPLHPRLDWQMWFASLGSYQNSPWFYQLLARMLQGSKDVLELFKTNPFPTTPPKFIRAQFYAYHFNTLEDKQVTGKWWKRKYLREYAPPFSLKLDD